MNITEKCKKAGTALGVAASSGLVALTSSITAFADVDVDGAVGKLKNGSADGGTFKDLIGKLTTVGSDLYTLAVTIGITIAATKNTGKRDEAKGWIVGIIIGGLLVFGAPTLTIIIAGIVRAI